MPHDEPHGARLSSSHGALNGCYSLPTRASSVILDSGLHLVPYFKPLRSIREHGHTFLDPAASADGMLRKTTETGNIGLFSINTGRPTTLRPRASLGDLRQPHRPFDPSSSDRPPAQDDRKRLPSYHRDSTSEIISMYGSDNQSSAKSVSGTLSPPWDDCGQRSNSMTTCGSKGHTLPRNKGTPQPHDVHSGAQRPRSPYPYPTRLPRPGIRPSSPALTENGNVDYSRMVEIDRIPQRTVHHPHKPLFPYKTTRDQPAPLSMRYGINQSTRSLSDEHGPSRTLPPPMPRRPPLPNHIHPWGLRPRHRLGSESSDQSMRTMSLTSSNGGYGCAPPQTPTSRIPEKKPPIFYDYSEDFEDAVAPPPDLPIANPTPTRMSTSFGPSLSDNGCDDGSESADEGVGHVVDYLRRMTMIESAEDQHGDESQNQETQGEHEDNIFGDHDLVSQSYHKESPAQPSYYEPAEEGVASSPVLPMLAQTAESSYISTVALDDHQDAMVKGHSEDLNHTMESTANGLVSETSTAESPLGPVTPNHDMRRPPVGPAKCENHPKAPDNHEQDEEVDDDELSNQPAVSHVSLAELVIPMPLEPGLPNCLSASLPYRYGNGRKDSRFYSISSGLSDLASFVKNVDKHMQTLDRENADQEDTPVAELMPNPLSAHGRSENQNIDETSAPPRKSSLANQRRSYAGPKSKSTDPVDELERFQVVSTRSGPTLVPQPISPAKLLRLKNSIPQLMKALPPLPSYSPASESPYNPTIVPVEFEPFEFSRLTDARSTLIESFRSQGQEEEAPEVYDPFVFDRAVRKPKLKLKTPSSYQSAHVRRARPRHHESGSATPSESCGTRQSSIGEYSTAPVKRRLPIKLSRPALESLTAEDTGTVKRRPGIDKSSTVSELASLQPVDLFSPSTALEKAVQHTKSLAGQQSTTSDRDYGTLPVVKSSSMARIQHVTVVDEGRGASLDTQLDALHSPRSRNETATENGMQSFFTDSLTKPQRGLRKRLSNLKSRLTESRHHHHAPTISVAVHGDSRDKSASGSQSPHDTRAFFTETNPAQNQDIVTRPRTVRSKWGKLLKGAKQRLRTWGKNRHKDQ